MENTNNEAGFVSIGTTTNTNEPSTIKIVKPDILVEIDNLKKKVVELLEAEKLEKLATAQNPRTLEEVFKALDAKLQEILVAINSIMNPGEYLGPHGYAIKRRQHAVMAANRSNQKCPSGAVY